MQEQNGQITAVAQKGIDLPFAGGDSANPQLDS
jgi:hypothetical protein